MNTKRKTNKDASPSEMMLSQLGEISLQAVLVWTPQYRPFIMGGGVNAPMGCWLVPQYVVVDDNGPGGLRLGIYRDSRVIVFELTSGAIVGNDVHEVLNDYDLADRKVVKEQIREALIMRNRVEVITPTEFFRKYQDAKGL